MADGKDKHKVCRYELQVRLKAHSTFVSHIDLLSVAKTWAASYPSEAPLEWCLIRNDSSAPIVLQSLRYFS